MEIPGGGGVKNERPSVGGGVWIFSGNTHYKNNQAHYLILLNQKQREGILEMAGKKI